jgi:hypothetical protein
MKLLPYVVVGLTQIVAAFLVPIHYQPIIGMALLSLGLKTFNSLECDGWLTALAQKGDGCRHVHDSCL